MQSHGEKKVLISYHNIAEVEVELKNLLIQTRTKGIHTQKNTITSEVEMSRGNLSNCQAER